jgi:hypothetical protein
MSQSTVEQPKVVSQAEWIAARKELWPREEFDAAESALAEEQALPRVKAIRSMS